MKKRFGKRKTRGRGFLGALVFAAMLGTAFLLPGTGIFASAASNGPAAVQGQAGAQSGVQTIAQAGGQAQGQPGVQTIAQSGGQAIVPVTLAAAVLQDSAVYALPQEGSAAVGTAAAGQALNICGRTADGWYETVFGNGIGYVKNGAVTEIAVDKAMAEALAAQAQFVKAQQVQAVAQQQEALRGQAPAAGNLIFVGDSRTGQMGNAVGGSAAYPGTAFVACFGGGVDWLSGQKAKQDIDKFVTPGSVIILNYGVNDLPRHNDYISLINRYAADWREKGAAVYFASVGPVGENEYGKRNWAVEYFNGQLGSRLDRSIGRIDLYGYLTSAGYATLADGMHYTPDTYARMFRFLCQSVGR